MSYTQTDHALDMVLQLATIDTTSLDPDELAEIAERAVAQAMLVRDGYDENGYPNGYGEDKG